MWWKNVTPTSCYYFIILLWYFVIFMLYLLALQMQQWKKVKVKSLSHVQLFATPWTVALQAPPSMGFSREGYWSGLPFPSPRDLSDPGIERGSSSLQADSLPAEPPRKPMFFLISEKCTLKKTGFGGKVGVERASPNLLWLKTPALTRDSLGELHVFGETARGRCSFSQLEVKSLWPVRQPTLGLSPFLLKDENSILALLAPFA